MGRGTSSSHFQEFASHVQHGLIGCNVQYSALLVPTSALEGLERFSFMRIAVYETGFVGLSYFFFFFRRKISL